MEMWIKDNFKPECRSVMMVLDFILGTHGDFRAVFESCLD